MNGEAKHDFVSVLDKVLAADRDVDDGPIPATSFDYLAVADELHSGRIQVSDEAVAAEYRDMADTAEDDLERLFAAVEEVASEEQLSVEADDISRELGLGNAIQPAELARIRRAFAFRNHPDRVAPHLRRRAMVRMQVANMLIDEATQRVRD